jgi:glycosyltransferase involved in cell wall biosynthesis
MVDYWPGSLRRISATKRHSEADDTRAVVRSHIVIVNSNTLYSLYSHVRRLPKPVPLGFRADDFIKIKAHAYILPSHISSPIIGYIGAINERLDISLLQHLAQQMPSYTFILAGPKDDSEQSFHREIHSLFSMPNVQYIGNIAKKDIPSLIRQFDICIIPYRTDQNFNVFSFPMKIMEYFYFGKPIVSCHIQEVTRYEGLIQMARTRPQWCRKIHHAATHPPTKTSRKAMRAIALANSWRAKIQTIDGLIREYSINHT